ncbi:MAG: lytic murein transglycosylase B [Pseudomonadota bacterium]
MSMTLKPLDRLQDSLSRCRRALSAGLLGAVILTPLSGQAQPVNDTPYAQREDVRQFATDLAQRRGWPEAWVLSVLSKARYQATVTRLIMPSSVATPKDWFTYRTRMVEPVRLKTGLAFWQAHDRWLRRAEQRYGVPPDIVLGIVGVESIYGRQMGRLKVIDALATLSFDFPSGRSDRSAFFRTELESLLALARREQIDPMRLKGSFAGAVGMPQFMPSSIEQHAVDFDSDGHIDLSHSAADVIGSVANYLVAHGWQRDWPTHFEVTPPAEPQALTALLGPDIVPLFSPQEFVDKGAWLPSTALDHPGKLALVKLLNGESAPSYVAGTSNFYVITRYNWSSYYAMAVISLGEALRRARGSDVAGAL